MLYRFVSKIYIDPLSYLYRFATIINALERLIIHMCAHKAQFDPFVFGCHGCDRRIKCLTILIPSDSPNSIVFSICNFLGLGLFLLEINQMIRFTYQSVGCLSKHLRFWMLRHPCAARSSSHLMRSEEIWIGRSKHVYRGVFYTNRLSLSSTSNNSKINTDKLCLSLAFSSLLGTLCFSSLVCLSSTNGLTPKKWKWSKSLYQNRGIVSQKKPRKP